MKMHDVTVPMAEGMPTWPGDPGLSVKLFKSMARGDRSNVTELNLGVHTGTHIDAPFHFEPGGAGVDTLPLELLIGRCRVMDASDAAECIDRARLEAADLKGVTRLLFKTRNSHWWKENDRRFHHEFVYLDHAGAEYLIEQGIKLVGIDYLSIEKYKSPDHATHHALLQNGVIIIEGLNLSEISAGDYELIALPMKLAGADGAPTRVVLWELTV
jgi:arylformamidase